MFLAAEFSDFADDVRKQKSNTLSVLKALETIENAIAVSTEIHMRNPDNIPSVEDIECLVDCANDLIGGVNTLIFLSKLGEDESSIPKVAYYGNLLEKRTTAPLEFVKNHGLPAVEWSYEDKKNHSKLVTDAEAALLGLRGAGAGTVNADIASALQHISLHINGENSRDPKNTLAGIRIGLRDLLKGTVADDKSLRDFLQKTVYTTDKNKVDQAVKTLVSFANIIDMAVDYKKYTKGNWDLFPRQFISYLRDFESNARMLE